MEISKKRGTYRVGSRLFLTLAEAEAYVEKTYGSAETSEQTEEEEGLPLDESESDGVQQASQDTEPQDEESYSGSEGWKED